MTNKLQKIYILIIISALLCSCAAIQDSGEKGAALKAAESSQVIQEYYFEPDISVIEGKLITRMYYGPPGYGEDPDKDAQEHPFIIQLNAPIKVIAKDGDTSNSDISDVIEIQVVPMNESEIDTLKQSLNKPIKIQGTLFSAFTGHHYTDVLIQVDKIID